MPYYARGMELIEYILKIQQGEVNKLEFSKLILSFFVRERIKITQPPNE